MESPRPASRLAAQPEFLTQLSMEMRTLLNDILGSAELLRREAGGENANVEHILNGGRRLLKLAESLVPADGATKAPAVAAAASRDFTVLYIEDNRANFLLVERVLKRRPAAKLVNATRGDSGLAIAREQRPQMILLDLNLPDMHGSELLAALLKNPETRAIPVVVLSADASARQIDKLLSAGARNYLTKPLDIDRLLHAVDEVMRERERARDA